MTRGTGIAGERDTPRDLGCQWIKKSEPETVSQKPSDGVYTRGAHKALSSGLVLIWAEDVFVSRSDGNRPKAKWLRLMLISAFFRRFKDYSDGPLLRMLGREVVSC